MDLVTTAAAWLHLLATVMLVGYYVVLVLIVMPAIRQLGAAQPVQIIAILERRAMPMLIGSLVVLLATRVYLLTGNGRYAGPGNVGGTWATLLLVKHVLIVGMLALGSYLDGLIVRAAAEAGPSELSLTRIVSAFRAMAVLGAAVLLLTSVVQAA